jgi:hypothetical protein
MDPDGEEEKGNWLFRPKISGIASQLFRFFL